MNKRIQEIYKETTGKDWVYDFDPDYAEKFAELIIEKCAELADESTSKPFDSYGKKIKHHFGVQE